MTKGKIRLGIVGVGNCASALVQGLEFYKDARPGEDVPGLMHVQLGDYHVLGFMGGWNGFLQNPFGRGLGVGGNLSEGFYSIDWSAAQQAGSVDGAVESAVGVMLFQMGIAALAPLGFCFAMALKAWRLYASSGILTQGLAGFGVMVVLVNGLFQEEALFAPPALGLLCCLLGLVIGNHSRQQTVSA